MSINTTRTPNHGLRAAIYQRHKDSNIPCEMYSTRPPEAAPTPFVLLREIQSPREGNMKRVPNFKTLVTIDIIDYEDTFDTVNELANQVMDYMGSSDFNGNRVPFTIPGWNNAWAIFLDQDDLINDEHGVTIRLLYEVKISKEVT